MSRGCREELPTAAPGRSYNYSGQTSDGHGRVHRTPERGHRSTGVQGKHALTVSESKAVAVHLEDMDVMREAVEQRAGEPRHVGDMLPA